LERSFLDGSNFKVVIIILIMGNNIPEKINMGIRKIKYLFFIFCTSSY